MGRSPCAVETGGKSAVEGGPSGARIGEAVGLNGLGHHVDLEVLQGGQLGVGDPLGQGHFVKQDRQDHITVGGGNGLVVIEIVGQGVGFCIVGEVLGIGQHLLCLHHVIGDDAGKPTTDFIKKVLNKVTLFGAIYLGVVAILPLLIGKIVGNSSLSIGGTSVIIVVGVALETVQALESQMLMRQYKGFLE